MTEITDEQVRRLRDAFIAQLEARGVHISESNEIYGDTIGEMVSGDWVLIDGHLDLTAALRATLEAAREGRDE